MSIPSHWTRTSRKPVMVNHYEWLSYRTGINRFALHCSQIDAVVAANYNLNGYHVSFDGEVIKSASGAKAKRFTSERNAMLAAIKRFEVCK